jgi:hypothetical protein
MRAPYRLARALVWSCLSALGAAVLPAGAVAPGAADWPCEQALVPEVSAAVVWAGPPPEGLERSWREVPEVAALVERVAAPGVDPAAAEAAIAAFARGLPEEALERRLTLLFAGVLETLNAERTRLLQGIRRYSRDQERRAGELGDLLTEMVRLEQAPAGDAGERLAELRRQIEWEQRVFDERERSIQYLCTRPVAVEQRLGALARAIAAHLP